MMFKFQHGFAVMRIQPLHNGHRLIIDRMLMECKKISIVIGSKQESRTVRNPFTFQERKLMIENIYRDNSRSSDIEILGMDDVGNDDIWYNSVVNLVKNGRFGMADVYYCGDKVNESYLNRGDFKIVNVDRSKQVGNCNISATEIREMVRSGDENWKKFIPSQNIEYLEKLFGIFDDIN